MFKIDSKDTRSKSLDPTLVFLFSTLDKFKTSTNHAQISFLILSNSEWINNSSPPLLKSSENHSLTIFAKNSITETFILHLRHVIKSKTQSVNLKITSSSPFKLFKFSLAAWLSNFPMDLTQLLAFDCMLTTSGSRFKWIKS